MSLPCVLKSDFQIYNNTDKAMHFVDVFHSCGCTNAELQEKKLQPEQKTILHMEVDLHNRSGRQAFASQLVDKENKSYECMIRTELRERIEFVPATLNLGLVNVGERMSGQLMVKFLSSVGARDFPEVVDVRALSEQFKVTIVENRKETSPDFLLRKVGLEIALAPPSAAGAGSGEVLAVYRDGASTFQKKVVVYWAAQSAYVITPSRIFFNCRNDPNGKGKFEKEVRIRRLDGKPFGIKEVKSTNGAVGSSIDSPSKSEQRRVAYNVILTLDESKMDKALWGELKVETDDPVMVQPELENRQGRVSG